MAAYTLDAPNAAYSVSDFDQSTYGLKVLDLGARMDAPNAVFDVEDFDQTTMDIRRLNMGEMMSLTDASAMGSSGGGSGDGFVWYFDGTNWHLALS